jgi:GMP synthase (glutamine-hydrolysing)
LCDISFMRPPLLSAAVIRHVHFEDLGTLAAPLVAAGYDVLYYDVGFHDVASLDPDLLIVLGAPVGVYEMDRYPFLATELALLEARLAAARPTLGICLGAQLIARALGARVYPSGIKEIGWAPLTLTAAGSTSPLAHLGTTPVLHWHGDTFDLPNGSTHLAATPQCANQAFAVGPHVLGMQFHPEIDAAAGIEPWLVGHAAELAGAGIDPRALRAATAAVGGGPRLASQAMMVEWLAGLDMRDKKNV